MKAIYVLTAVLCLGLPAFARAELKWEQTTLELNPGPSEKQAIGHFKYQNTGDQPVHFKSVKTSCGCTAAQTQKDQVGPGEKGEITATFNIGDRTGPQVKTVTVETDDTASPVTQLTLKANIKQILEVQPNFVFWQAGEEPKAKTVTAKAGKDVPVKDIQVTSPNPQFEAKVEKGSAPGEFKINIQPKQTNAPAFTTIAVKPDYPKDSPKTYYVNARITAPPAKPVVSPAVPASSPAAPGSTH